MWETTKSALTEVKEEEHSNSNSEFGLEENMQAKRIKIIKKLLKISNIEQNNLEKGASKNVYSCEQKYTVNMAKEWYKHCLNKCN